MLRPFPFSSYKANICNNAPKEEVPSTTQESYKEIIAVIHEDLGKLTLILNNQMMGQLKNSLLQKKHTSGQ